VSHFHPFLSAPFSVSLTGAATFPVPLVASSSAANGKHSRLAFVSRSSAPRGRSDANSVLNTDDTTPIIFTRPSSSMTSSFMVSTTAIDCRTSQLGYSDCTAAQWLVGVLCHYICATVPYSAQRVLPFPFPIHVVPTRVHRPLHMIIYGCHLYPSSSYALTFVAALPNSTTPIDVLMTSRFSNRRTYLRLFQQLSYLHRCVTGT
jgi:hypothetical protein